MTPLADPEIFRAAERRMRELHGAPIGLGGCRRVFRDVETILKVPTCRRGCLANEQEAASWDAAGNPVGWLIDGVPLPRARCWADGALSAEIGLPILRMEFVRCARVDPDLPPWTTYVDSRQVGYTAAGRLVAYDWECAPSREVP